MTDIQSLFDERDIARALSRFTRIIDGKRWTDLPDVFARDLSFDYGNGEMTGIAALEAQMRRYLDICGPTQHLIGSLLIDVDGNCATSSSYIQARHQRRADPVGQIFDTSGEYQDQWERRPEGWRIIRRDAIWAIHAGDPAILGASDSDLA